MSRLHITCSICMPAHTCKSFCVNKDICSVVVGSSADLQCTNADLGQYVANSVSRPTANPDGFPRQASDPRGKDFHNSSIRLQHAVDPPVPQLSVHSVPESVCCLNVSRQSRLFCSRSIAKPILGEHPWHFIQPLLASALLLATSLNTTSSMAAFVLA